MDSPKIDNSGDPILVKVAVMSRGRFTSLSVSQLSVARRNAMARGWSNATVNAPTSATATRTLSRPLPISPDADPDAVRAFAYQVAMATQGPVLRYSQRLHLLALASDAGIARFDANLIIAAIENHRGPSRAAGVAKHPARSPLPAMLAAAAGVQALLVALTYAALSY